MLISSTTRMASNSMSGKLMFIDRVLRGQTSRITAPGPECTCSHCFYLRICANAPCTYCHKPIGYLRLFYNEGKDGCVHLKCSVLRQVNPPKPKPKPAVKLPPLELDYTLKGNELSSSSPKELIQESVKGFLSKLFGEKPKGS